MPQDNPSVGRRVFSRTIAKTLCLHRIFISRVVGSALIVLSLLAVMLFGAFSGFARPQTAIAQAPNTTLNFQARILNLNGSLVPDGDYHIEFKIYDTVSSGGTAQGACSGNCLWMETRTGGDVIRVVNGYVSANLGSVTSFPSNMPWGNNLYVTMRVGGAGGSPSWDAQEMTNSGNRMKMSVAPVAFVANNVASGSTNSASTNSSTISIQSGNALGTTSNSGNITIDSGTATGTTGTITLGATNASALTLGRSGLTTTNAGALTVTQALTASSTITLTTLGTTDNSTFICRNTTNILAGCNYTPLSSSLTDNITDAFDLQEGTNNYININTTNTTENISFGNATTNPSYNFLGSGTLTVAGNTQLNGNLTVAAGKYIALTGGNTASRPGSPTEGMVYFDSTTDSLLTYANGKWQSDRGEFVVVAANDSSQAEKDSADYVADGTADQTEINSALTEAAGGKVILLAGTYVANATILIPNNTTLAGAGRGTLIELADLDATENLIENTDQTTGTGVTIRDIRIDGRDDLNTAGTQEGIYLLNMGGGTGPTARQGAKITNVIANNFRTDGVYLESSSNSTLSGNTFQGNFYGLSVYLGAYNTVTNNIAQGNSQLGFYIGTNNNTFTNNVAQGGETGFYTEQAVSNTISGNSTEGNGYVGYYVDDLSNSNIFTGNTSNTDEDYGFYIIGASTYNSFIGNSVRNSINGFRLENASNNNLISDNKIHDSGGATTNNGIYLDASDNNTITGNDISDTGCSINCYAINIFNSTSDNNYLEGNTFTTSSGTATINDSGTGTRYANQTTAQNGLDILFKQSNSTTAFRIQDSTGGNAFTVNTTTLGISTGGTLAVTGNTTLTGDLAVNGNDITTGAGDLTITPAGGDTIVTGTLAVTTLGSADTSTFVCRNSSNQLATCSSTPLTNSLTDNITDAFDLQEGANNYININTTNTTENISFGNATTNPSYSFLGSGALTVNGASTFNSSLTAKGQLLADGTSANQTQLIVRANASQTVANPLVLLQNSSSAELARINATTTSLYFGNAAGGNSAAGVNNTGIGASALGSVLTGTGNTTLGSGALASVSVNDNNTAVGYNAGNLATGGNNIFLGALAGDNVTTGTDNIIIGYNLDASASGATNELRIGGVLQGNTSTLAAQFNGALTVTGLLTGNLGATVTGATTNLNVSSNFATNINTGTSTGAVAIGNSLSTTTVLGATNINVTGATTTTIGNATSALNINGTTTIAAGLSQTGANTFSTGTGATSLNGATSVTGTNTLTVGTGLTSLGGGLNVTAGNTTLTADLAVNGNTTIGNATTDRLTVTSYILGANALVFEGATDGNGFATTLQVTDPTANNTIVLPNASGTILIAPAGSGNGLVQVPTSNSAGVAGANVISPTAASIVGLTVNGTTSTAAVALAVAQTGTATAMTVSQTQNNAGLTITANALTTANGLTVSSSGTGLTTGSLISVSSATTGAVATNGIVSLSATGNYTSTSNIGLLSVLANATQAGTIQNIQGNALTTGNALRISSTGTGLTTGSLFYGTSATTGAVATNGIFSLNATGNYTSTSNVGLLNIVANATTAGTVQQIQANALTTGDALNINSSGTGLTTGSLLRVSTATTGAIATDGAVSIQATGNYTSTSGIGLLSVLANTTQAGTVANIQANALTTGDALNISSTGTGLTTGSLLRVSTATTGAIATDGAVSIQATGNYTSTSNIGFVSIQANTTQAGTIQNIQGNALTSGQALYVSSSGTGLTTGSLFYGTSATTSAVATNGIFSLNATGNYTSTSNTGLLNVAANATTAGTITNIQGNALTTGTALNVTSTGTLTTTGNIATFTANSATTATGVVAINATGLTTGSALNVTTGASAIAFNATGRAIVTGTANDAALGSVSSVVATATSATNGQFGINSTLTVSPGSASTQAYGAIIGYATTSSSNLSTGSATISGFNGIAQNAGSGNLVNAFGGGVQVLNLSTGTLYNATGLYIANATNSGGGTITRSVGALVANQSVGTTNINLLLGPINAVGISGNWSIYSNSAYDSSLLGNLRIGSNVAPTVALDVTGSGLITQSSNTNTLSVVNDSLTTATGTALTTTGVLTTTGNLLTLTANSATTATGVLTVNATALTTGAGITVNTGTATAISAGGNITFQEVTGTRVLGVQTRTTNVTGTNLTVQSGQGGTTSAGGLLTLQGGSGGATSGNGGNVMLVGGTATSGTKGLVVVDTATFSAQTVQNFTANANITQASIDSFGSILISGNVAGWIATLTDPSNTTTGRVIYVTNSGSVDMTLAANTVGVALSITLKPASTATMYWNGVDWTAAGASSSTDLQAAYDNTATNAGGAELVLNASGGAADGLTIRNNGTTPIIGGLLEVQSSIGSNLFTVNNNATEFANNGGAESATFTMWTGAFAGGTVTRNSPANSNVATGQGSVSVVTGAVIGHGAENTLTTALTPNLKYAVAYTVKGNTNFSTLETVYSRDGTNTSTVSCNSAQTVTTSQFTRINCTFTAPSSGIIAANSIFIRQTDASIRTFFIDNLSVTVSADVNHGSDGSVDLALGTNWTDFGANTAGTTAAVRNTSVLYDTSGSVEKTTGATADRGIVNNLSINPAVSTQYLVTFYARSSNTFNDIRVRYSRDGGTNFVSCVDYNTQSLSTTAYTRITCIITTDGSAPSNPDLVIDQPTATARTFYVDALTMTLNTNNSNNVQIGGGNRGGPTTLFTLDRAAGNPIAANNDAYLGSMYYDTITGRIQCYEADGWGACGAAPDNIVNLNPEYAGAVLNGSGVGTMTADFCATELVPSTVLSVNTALCAEGEARNYYKWTSPQLTQQTYSVYVTYQLPATFNGFSSDDTIQLTARTDSTTNAAVTYEVFRSTGSAVTACGTETTVVTTANTWQSVGINGNEATGCGFNSSAAGNFVIFKINMKANTNASAYVSTLSFVTTGR